MSSIASASELVTDPVLLREAMRRAPPASSAIGAVEPLRQLVASAMHDRVGGGFHHGLTAPAGRVPDFQKRLEDQALFAIAYTEAWQLTRDDELQRVATGTLDYALRDLAEKNGAFHSAQGEQSIAPVGGGPRFVVGRYYAWEMSELRRLLGKDAELIAYRFGMTDGGNVPPELDPAGDLRGLNLLAVTHSDEEVRRQFRLTGPELRARLDAALARMQLVRSHRPRPPWAASVETASNALMISALARAASAFDDDHYAYAAAQSARFFATTLYDARRGVLRHAATGGEADLRDYATAVQAMTDLYEATFQPRWLRLAIDLQSQVDPRLRGDGDRVADVRTADTLSSNLLRLAALTDNATWRARGEAIARGTALPPEAPVKTVLIVGDRSADDARALLRVTRAAFDPPRVVLWSDGRGERDPLAAWCPLLKSAKRGREAAAMVCVGAVCGSALTSPDVLVARLSR